MILFLILRDDVRGDENACRYGAVFARRPRASTQFTVFVQDPG